MTEKYSQFSNLTSCIKCFLLIGCLFLGNSSISKQLSISKGNEWRIYNQKDPFGNTNAKTKIPVYFETVEDTDDDNNIDIGFSSKEDWLRISSPTVIVNNYTSPQYYTENRLPLYILFHSWKSFIG